MATKDYCLLFKDKQQNFVVNNNQYKNLNLNQNYNQHCVENVQSKNVRNHNKNNSNYDLCHNNDSQTRQNNSTLFGNTKYANFNTQKDYGINEDPKETKISNKSSTLSLHIYAYENSIDATSGNDPGGEKDETNKKKESISSIKNWKSAKELFNSSAINYAFELPRQQHQDQKNDPEVMQFKASQRLSNVNRASSLKRKQRPKSKEEKLRERQKHILDEPIHKELFLDKGGEEDPQSDNDDDMPEEISTKKSEQKEPALPLLEKKKKNKKRKIIKKEGPGIYQVSTEDINLKVVAAATTPAPSQMLQPTINFREMLLQESTKGGRRKAGKVSKHVEKWIKPC